MKFSVVVEIIFALALATCPAGPSQKPRHSAPATTLWSAGHELGNTSEWYAPSAGAFGPSGGGEFDSGIARSAASKDHAHTGSWGLAMTITTPPESGTRMFRWREPRRYAELFYSVWFYIPARFSVRKYWNLFQWKSRPGEKDETDPFFCLNAGNRPDGSLYLYLFDSHTRVTYSQGLRNIPVGKWFRVQAFHRCAGDRTGAVSFWQDGVQILDVRNVQTRYANGDCQWSVNNYSDGISPSPSTIYIDDAAISTAK